jgi:hypothetical protein
VATSSDTSNSSVTPSIQNTSTSTDTSTGTGTATASTTIAVADTIAPTITLNGANPQTIEVNTSYSELGATVTDDTDAGLIVVINSGAVNTTVVGSYTVTYNATDSAGNIASEVTRTVNVIEAPVVTDPTATTTTTI